MASNGPSYKQLSGKFRVLKDSSSGAVNKQSTRKTRESLVCNQCRESKLRCDKNQPCQTCCSKDQAEICSYERRIRNRANVPVAAIAEDRLERLEGLVKQLIQSQSSPKHALPTTPPWLSTELSNNSLGHDLDSSTYVGATHWSSVLDDIHEIKVAVAGSTDDADEHHNSQIGTYSIGGDIIFGSGSGYHLSDVLSYYLPEKLVTDRYLATFFQGETYIVPYIHAYQFQHEYQQFWRDPDNANPLWLSLLFSICHIASTFGGASLSDQSNSSQSMQGERSLHVAAGQCLVLGNYQRPQKFVIEALGMYGVCKNLQTLDPCREAGTILSMCVRMCYEMGYHRDPNHLGRLTAFEGEMRRRCWSAVKQMDLMVAFQLGLPSSICLENCDAKSPENLLDTDFDINSKILPPARPESESTRLLWFIVKDRLIIGFSKVWSEALSFTDRSETEIMHLEEEIRRLHESVPGILKARPLSDSIIDLPFLVVTRLYIEFIYLKSLCVLHRKYMTKGRHSSTKCCIQAAIQLVSQFLDMHKEFAPGGQLQGERWMLSNFTMNDFLLGNMILCQFIHLSRKKLTPKTLQDLPSEVDILKLLKQALVICIDKSTLSRDSQRVSRVIDLTINGVRRYEQGYAIQRDVAAGNSSSYNDSEIVLDGGPRLHSEPRSPNFDLDGSQVETSGWMDPFMFFEKELNGFDWTGPN